MSKTLFIFISLLLSSISFSHKYTHSNLDEGIHTTFVSSKWCGNLAVSTKIGHRNENGQCLYQNETPTYGFDFCGPFYLNGFLLEKEIGLGFDCAATHIHSNVTGEDAFDEYMLILDESGHYINTHPQIGQIDLGS